MASVHRVKQGEYLSSIAKKYGFANWRTIYNHPQNAEFKRKRPNPNVIYPGDRIFVPDKEEKQEPCATEQRHRFQIKRPKIILQIVLKDCEGKPLADTAYMLRVAEHIYEGTTNQDGLLRQEIPIGSESGELTLDEFKYTRKLHIGHLDPVDEVVQDQAVITGVQARLNNLGFYCGKVDGMFGPKTKAALKRFQQVVMQRQNPNGEPDKTTRDALWKAHGC